MINSVRHNKCLQGSEALNPTVAIKIQIAHNSLRSSMMNKNCCCTLRLWLSGVTDATDCTHILTSTARGQLSQRWQTQREKTILHEWMCLHCDYHLGIDSFSNVPPVIYLQMEYMSPHELYTTLTSGSHIIIYKCIYVLKYLFTLVLEKV